MSSNTKTKKHLENLKNPEYARKHRQKMIKQTIRELFELEDNPNASGNAASESLHKRNIETTIHNLLVEINAKPEEITWH